VGQRAELFDRVLHPRLVLIRPAAAAEHGKDQEKTQSRGNVPAHGSHPVSQEFCRCPIRRQEPQYTCAAWPGKPCTQATGNQRGRSSRRASATTALPASTMVARTSTGIFSGPSGSLSK